MLYPTTKTRKMKKKCLSYAFWGTSESVYKQGIMPNICLSKDHYPGWDIIIFAARGSLEEKFKNELVQNGATLKELDFYPGWSGMFWRMLAIFMSDYSHVCIRDLDSLISEREAKAVQEWIKEDYLLHVMRDHPAHTAPIMGGMFGIKITNFTKNMFRPVKKIILEAHCLSNQSYWQVDQEFLARNIYPHLQRSITEHDPYYAKKPFPSPRSRAHRYVGRPDIKLGEEIHLEDSSLIAVDTYLSQQSHNTLRNYR